jgi:uncharacterized cupin superfamily protein
MNFLIVKPGRREAFAHRHRTAEEIYVVLAGTGRSSSTTSSSNWPRSMRCASAQA